MVRSVRNTFVQIYLMVGECRLHVYNSVTDANRSGAGVRHHYRPLLYGYVLYTVRHLLVFSRVKLGKVEIFPGWLMNLASQFGILLVLIVWPVWLDRKTVFDFSSETSSI